MIRPMKFEAIYMNLAGVMIFVVRSQSFSMDIYGGYNSDPGEFYFVVTKK